MITNGRILELWEAGSPALVTRFVIWLSLWVSWWVMREERSRGHSRWVQLGGSSTDNHVSLDDFEMKAVDVLGGPFDGDVMSARASARGVMFESVLIVSDLLTFLA